MPKPEPAFPGWQILALMAVLAAFVYASGQDYYAARRAECLAANGHYSSTTDTCKEFVYAPSTEN